MEKLNGANLGQVNLGKVAAYLNGLAAARESLPERDGKPNMSAIAMTAGVDRQVLYKNPAVRAAIERAASDLGLGAYERRQEQAASGPDRRDQRILKLEQENAALRAENIELRRRLRTVEHVEAHMVATGRRTAR